MKLRSLPFSVIGLSIATVGLLAIVLFQNQQFRDESVNAGAPTNDAQQAQLLEETMSYQSASKIQAEIAGSSEAALFVTDLSVDQHSKVAAFDNTSQIDSNYECGETATSKDRYQFAVTTPQVAYQVEPGEAFSVPVYIKNIGTATWCGENTYSPNAVNTEQFKLRLGTALPQDRFSQILTGNPSRIFMDNHPGGGLILPGETAQFTITGVAPSDSGIYAEYFSPVVEGLSWYLDTKINLNLYVGKYTDEDISKLTYLRQTGNTNEINSDDRLTIVVDVDPSVQHEYVYLGNKLIGEYVISSGAAKTPTPVGTYTIYNKQELRIASGYPAYRMPYWVGLKDSRGRFRGYGLHALPYLGDNKSSSYFWQEAVSHLGIPVSHGCVRRGEEDAAWLWHIIDPETTVVRVVRNVARERFEAELFQELAMAQAEAA